jgi:hypothetical protein
VIGLASNVGMDVALFESFDFSHQSYYQTLKNDLNAPVGFYVFLGERPGVKNSTIDKKFRKKQPFCQEMAEVSQRYTRF